MYDLKRVREILMKNEVNRIHFCFNDSKGLPPTGRKYRLQDHYTHRLSITKINNRNVKMLLDILKEEDLKTSIRTGGDCRMLMIIETENEKDNIKIWFSENSDYIDLDGSYYDYIGNGLRNRLNGFCKKYFDSRYDITPR